MAETTTDHQTIQEWAAKHKGKPAAVKKTHSDNVVGILRIMFPRTPNSEHDDLVEISWEDFFREFEDKKLALLYESGSMFSKLVERKATSNGKGRGTAQKPEHG